MAVKLEPHPCAHCGRQKKCDGACLEWEGWFRTQWPVVVDGIRRAAAQETIQRKYRTENVNLVK